MGLEGFIFVEIGRFLWKCDLREGAAKDRVDRYSHPPSQNARKMVRSGESISGWFRV
jgi:hypothetical protein